MGSLSPVLPLAMIVAIGAVGAALSGCTGGGELERALDDYAHSVRELAGTRVGPSSSGERSAEPLYPEPRERRLQVEEIRVGPLSALSLRRCSLLGLVGERNSVLGRIQSSSGRLRYEVAFLANAVECVAAEEQEGRGDGALARQLREIVETKARDLPAVFWNATFGANEVARHFGAGGAGAAMELQAADDEALLAAWQTLAEMAESILAGGGGEARPWRQLSDRLEDEELGRTLEALRDQTRGGTLRALALLASRLDEVSGLLEARAVDGCGEREQVEALRAIEERFWSGDLRGRTEALSLRTERWLRAVDRAWKGQSAEAPEAVEQYRAQWLTREEPGVLASLRAAVRRHDEAWRALFSDCEILSAEGPKREASP